MVWTTVKAAIVDLQWWRCVVHMVMIFMSTVAVVISDYNIIIIVWLITLTDCWISHLLVAVHVVFSYLPTWSNIMCYLATYGSIYHGPFYNWLNNDCIPWLSVPENQNGYTASFSTILHLLYSMINKNITRSAFAISLQKLHSVLP